MSQHNPSLAFSSITFIHNSFQRALLILDLSPSYKTSEAAFCYMQEMNTVLCHPSVGAPTHLGIFLVIKPERQMAGRKAEHDALSECLHKMGMGKLLSSERSLPAGIRALVTRLTFHIWTATAQPCTASLTSKTTGLALRCAGIRRQARGLLQMPTGQCHLKHKESVSCFLLARLQTLV